MSYYRYINKDIFNHYSNIYTKLFIIVSVSTIFPYKCMHNIFITNRQSFTLHKRSGADVKTVNAVERESFINIFKIPEQLYDTAYTQVVRETTSEILGSNSD